MAEEILMKVILTIVGMATTGIIGYLSGYGRNKRNFEAWAEIFTQMELGESTPLTEAMEKYLARWM